jgi:hypothetical protein
MLVVVTWRFLSGPAADNRCHHNGTILHDKNREKKTRRYDELSHGGAFLEGEPLVDNASRADFLI